MILIKALLNVRWEFCQKFYKIIILTVWHLFGKVCKNYQHCLSAAARSHGLVARFLLARSTCHLISSQWWPCVRCKESTCAGDKNESCPTVSYLTQIWPCGVRKHVRSTVIWEPCQLPATRKEEMGGGSFADYDWRGQRGSSLGWVKLLEVVGSGSPISVEPRPAQLCTNINPGR